MELWICWFNGLDDYFTQFWLDFWFNLGHTRWPGTIAECFWGALI